MHILRKNLIHCKKHRSHNFLKDSFMQNSLQDYSKNG